MRLCRLYELLLKKHRLPQLPGFFAARFRSAQQRFQNAQTPMEEREAISVLMNPAMQVDLGPEFAFAAAGAGSYRLKLTVNGNVYTGTISIREDPILDKD